MCSSLLAQDLLVMFCACSLISSMCSGLFVSSVTYLYSICWILICSHISFIVSSVQFCLGLPTLLFLGIRLLNVFCANVILCRLILSFLIILNALFIFVSLYTSWKRLCCVYDMSMLVLSVDACAIVFEYFPHYFDSESFDFTLA